MKHIATLIVFAAIALLFAFRFPANSEIKWMEWDDAYEKAKKTKKVILIDAYTDWCGWCKKMDKDTYSQKQIANYVNKNFLPVKFNPELKDKKYVVNGKEMTGGELLYNLSNGQSVGYPTTFFLSIKHNEVQKISGYKGKDDFMLILEEKKAWGEVN